MRTVLIPTDFSSNALHALRYAQELYKCERTSFYVLHAYADEVYGPFGRNTDNSEDRRQKEIRQAVEASLEKTLVSIIGEPPNPLHSFETIASFESLVDAVNDFVNQINMDLVIMGTKGKTADKKVTFGSHTVQVFKYVSCPVLAVPEDFVYEQPKRILFPSDYTLPYKRRELKLLNDIAREFKSQIYSLYISDFEHLSHRQEDNKLFLKESLSQSYLNFERTSLKNKTEAILDQVAKKDINLIVMVNSRHSFLEDMLYRSTVDEIGLSIKIPFLVMQNLPR